ncbi:hypothetical protein EYR38_001956 [Pleurotus pulmonarius]|nr:hypothetical protein EYR38_001956 [Pleurotus pulmonarius]
MSEISAAPPDESATQVSVTSVARSHTDIDNSTEHKSLVPPEIDDQTKHTPNNRRLANYHSHSMSPVDISKLRKALVQETRGQYGTWQFMSASLTQNTENVSHTVVDDRESALHVLIYMALKHLRHNIKTHQRLRGLLAVFDSYVSMDGEPDVGTDDKRSMLCAGGPAVQFTIPAITLLIKTLAKFFSPRYIEDYDPRNEALELMSEEDLTEHEKEKEQHCQRLAKLLDPTSDFVYTTMRHWAAKMPEPLDNITQWVDNMKGQGESLKRAGSHLVSTREKIHLRYDGLVSFKTGDTCSSTSSD